MRDAVVVVLVLSFFAANVALAAPGMRVVAVCAQVGYFALAWLERKASK